MEECVCHGHVWKSWKSFSIYCKGSLRNLYCQLKLWSVFLGHLYFEATHGGACLDWRRELLWRRGDSEFVVEVLVARQGCQTMTHSRTLRPKYGLDYWQGNTRSESPGHQYLQLIHHKPFTWDAGFRIPDSPRWDHTPPRSRYDVASSSYN